jgi:hypothetical protein
VKDTRPSWAGATSFSRLPPARGRTRSYSRYRRTGPCD